MASTTKQQLLKENRMELIEWLRVDKDLILQYVYSKSIINDKDYNELKQVAAPDDRNSDLLDKVYNKGEDKCAQFFDLLKLQKIQDAYPGLSSLSASGSGEGSSGSASKDMVRGDHFIDKYRPQLIDRVTNVNAILDHLLAKEVITQEIYDDIRGERKRAEKMREIMSNIYKSKKGKDILYEALMAMESFLMAELKEEC